MALYDHTTAVPLADILNHILSTADVVGEADGKRFLLLEVSDDVLDTLAAFDADREDAEEDDPAERNGDEGDFSGSVDDMVPEARPFLPFLNRFGAWETTDKPDHYINRETGEVMHIPAPRKQWTPTRGALRRAVG